VSAASHRKKGLEIAFLVLEEMERLTSFLRSEDCAQPYPCSWVEKPATFEMRKWLIFCGLACENPTAMQLDFSTKR
jgi:hypothetical protein